MIRLIRIVLLALIIVVAGAVIFEINRPYRPDNPIDAFIDEVIGRPPVNPDAAFEPPIEYIELPADADLEGFLPVSPGRQDYVDGEMTLVIPLLDFNKAIKAGTSYPALRIAPGLFEASGMPGEAGANVSIAGHRTRDAFYFLDRLGEEDRIYLIYDTYIYTYVFYDRSVVRPSEWSVISEQGFDACTLITCTPIGAGNRRMIVRFILENVAKEEDASGATDRVDFYS